MQKSRIVYDNQNYFQLASIPSAGAGFSVIIIGKNLAALYGAGTAICSIVLGNLILWVIAISVISMVDKEKANAIDNIKEYIGRYGGMTAALILMIAFLNWYAFQITFSVDSLNHLFQGGISSGMIIRIGAAAGLFCALLAIGGIHLLRRVSVISLPILLGYYLYAVTTFSGTVVLSGTWGLSFTAVTTAVFALLPGIINFPTFFRHSRSKAHSYLALALMTLLVTFFEVSTIWMDFSVSSGLFGAVLMGAFVLVILTFCNWLNIYFASACWETFSVRFGESRGFAIIGLFGTLIYTFVQISTPVQFLQDLTNAYIATLGSVLLMAYLTRIIVKHRLRPLEKLINLATWLVGCVVATGYELGHFLKGSEALFAGVSASLLFYMSVIVVEETAWAMKTWKKIPKAKKG